MARIAGINIPNHQHADIALTAIYGIGRARAQAICAAAGVQGNRKIKDLNDAELDRLRENVQRLTVEGDLRREVQMSIKRFLAILEPALILSLAVMIGGIVFSILLGVMGMSELVQ